MKKIIYSVFLIFGMLSNAFANDNISVSVDFSASMGGEQDGRLLVMLSNNNDREPRFQINHTAKGQLIFGRDVTDWKPGTAEGIDNATNGYPLPSLKNIPAGEYYVQALLNRYKDFNLSNGKTVSLPPEMGTDVPMMCSLVRQWLHCSTS